MLPIVPIPSEISECPIWRPTLDGTFLWAVSSDGHEKPSHRTDPGSELHQIGTLHDGTNGTNGTDQDGQATVTVTVAPMCGTSPLC